MPALSSSRLRLIDECCPGALDLAEANTPYDATVFAVGKVAHACLDALHAACAAAQGTIPATTAQQIATATALQMATQGSRFDGAPEAPVPLFATEEGIALALAQWAREGGAIDPGARAELGLGVDASWTPEPYPTATHWRAVVDLTGWREDEDGAGYLWVRDYKSAWTTGADAPRTLQMRGQILLAMAWAQRLVPDRPIDRIGREVVNLRTGAVWTETNDLADNMTDDLLVLWRAEIDAAVRAVPVKPRPFRPGPGCGGCLYRRPCPAAPPPAVDLASTARRYAALLAEAEALKPVLRAATADRTAPLDLDGHTLGWRTTTRHKPATGAAEALAAAYATVPEPDPGLVGLTSHLIGVRGLRSAVDALHPGPRAVETRDALLARLLTTETSASWGFTPRTNPERKEEP